MINSDYHAHAPSPGHASSASCTNSDSSADVAGLGRGSKTGGKLWEGWRRALSLYLLEPSACLISPTPPPPLQTPPAQRVSDQREGTKKPRSTFLAATAVSSPEIARRAQTQPAVDTSSPLCLQPVKLPCVRQGRNSSGPHLWAREPTWELHCSDTSDAILFQFGLIWLAVSVEKLMGGGGRRKPNTLSPTQ